MLLNSVLKNLYGFHHIEKLYLFNYKILFLCFCYLVSLILFSREKLLLLVSCYLVYPVAKSSMTIRHCSLHADPVSYSSFFFSQASLFPLETSSFSPLHSSFPVVPYVTLDIVFPSAVPPFGGNILGIFLFIVSSLCKLVVTHFLTSNVCESI